MPKAIFVVHLDDYQGFIVKQRHPSSLMLNEKLLNMMFYEHQQDKNPGLKISDVEGMKVASFTDESNPSWFVCFVLSEDEDITSSTDVMTGMSRLILEMISEAPDQLELSEIFEKQSRLAEKSKEQECASVYRTPSTALILEKMQIEGVERAARLVIWLKSQIQSDDVDLREAIAPLMQAGLVKVEMVGKTTEMVFLISDIFCYRAPPVESLLHVKETNMELFEKYREEVASFFSPPPPNKGYNPTIPVDDPTMDPIMEDRKRIAEFLEKTMYYQVLKCLRKKPHSAEGIAECIAFPESIVNKILRAYESERIAKFFEEENLWALITNPKIELFMPEYTLKLISRKTTDKEITQEIATRHLDHLIKAWSEPM